MPDEDPNRFFAPDYAAAREAFRAAARRAGAKLDALPVAGSGPSGEALTIDLAWLGPARPQMALYVGLAITFTVLGFNLLGDALRDALDPTQRGRR